MPIEHGSTTPGKDFLYTIHDEGYSVARHVLGEVGAHPSGISAAEVGRLVADDESGSQAGAWLRSLNDRGLVRSERVTPGSTRVLWFLTDAGRQEISR